MMSIPFLLTRSFAALIWLYPLRFREEFGEEMETVFSDQVEDLSADGSLALMVLFLRELPHVVVNLARQHWANLNGGRDPGGMRSWSPSRLVRSSCLAFGAAAGLGTLLSLLSGLGEVKFYDYTPPIMLVSLLLSIVINGLPSALLWPALPQPGKKSDLLVPAVGVSLVSLSMLLATIPFMPRGPILDPAAWWFWAYGYPLIKEVLRGAVFSGLFAWATLGRRVVLPLALVGAAGKVLGYILVEGSVFLTYQVFHLNDELSVLLTQDPWFYLWMLALVILGGMVFGALFGWQVSFQEKQKIIGLQA